MFRPLLHRVLALLVAALPLACGEQEPREITISLEQSGGFVVTNPATPERPNYVDFGRVPEGELREYTYVLENSDPRPITVHKLQSSCGCTVPRVTAFAPDGTTTQGRIHGTGDVVTVPEGGRLELTITTDTKNVRVKNQHKLNTVRLTCDSEDAPYMSFEQHLWVVLAFNATPRTIDMKLVPEGGGAAASTELFPALEGSEARITGVHSHSDGLTVEYREESRLRGMVTIVTATLPPGLPRGAWSGEVWLDTTLDDGTGEGEPFLVPVHAQVVTDVVCSPPGLILGQLDPERGAELECVVRALIPGERMRITGHRTTGDAEALDVTYEPDAPGADGRSGRWNVKIKLGADYAATTLRGAIEFETDIASIPVLRVSVTGSFPGR